MNFAFLVERLGYRRAGVLPSYCLNIGDLQNGVLLMGPHSVSKPAEEFPVVAAVCYRDKCWDTKLRSENISRTSGQT